MCKNEKHAKRTKCLFCYMVVKHFDNNIDKAREAYKSALLENLGVPGGSVQASTGWLNARRRYITASDVASVMDNNDRFKSCSELVYFKSFPKEDTFVDNECTKWGKKWESEALHQYELNTGHIVYQVGLLRHQQHPDLLAGSPDALTLCGRLVEVKCPYKRSIPRSGPSTRKIPSYYQDQVLTLMTILNMRRADFVQFRPQGYGLQGKIRPKREQQLLITPFSITKEKLRQYENDLIDRLRNVVYPQIENTKSSNGFAKSLFFSTQ